MKRDKETKKIYEITTDTGTGIGSEIGHDHGGWFKLPDISTSWGCPLEYRVASTCPIEIARVSLAITLRFLLAGPLQATLRPYTFSRPAGGSQILETHFKKLRIHRRAYFGRPGPRRIFLPSAVKTRIIFNVNESKVQKLFVEEIRARRIGKSCNSWNHSNIRRIILYWLTFVNFCYSSPQQQKYFR